MQRTLTLRTLSYRRKNSRTDKDPKSLTELPGSTDVKTLDFFDFAFDALNNPDTVNQSDKRKGRYCRIVEVTPDPARRTIMVEARIAPYGEPGQIIDTTTDEVQEEHDGEKTNALTQRAVLVVPRNKGTEAYVGVENLSGMANPLGDATKRILEDAWNKKFGNFLLENEVVVRGDAWLKAADLAEVRLKYKKKTADFADDPVSVRHGRMVAVFQPEIGQRYFSKSLLPLLSTGDKKIAAAALGIQDEPDELQVKLGDGAQQKTFVIGRERTPAVRVLMTDHGIARPSDQEFVKASLSEVRDIVKRTSAVGWDLK